MYKTCYVTIVAAAALFAPATRIYNSMDIMLRADDSLQNEQVQTLK